jgi:pimeloyl-ACP methyl ester carboxylesterase
MIAQLELAFGKHQLALLRRAFAQASGLRRGTAQIDGHRLAYLDRGRGDPLVCVHGFGGDKETWLLMSPWVPRRLRTVLLDLPGHGASSTIAGDRAHARAQAEVVVRFLDHLGIDRAILAGNSMGGGVALRVASDHPDRVRGLVLVASAAPVWIPNELSEALDRGENLLVPDSREKTDAFLRTVTAKPPRVPRAVQRYVTAERVARQGYLDEIFRGWAGAAPDDNMPADLEAIDAPALVIHGARDRIIHPATADLLATRLPKARRVILDGIGHVPQIEDPRRVARLVDEFTRRLRA